MIERSQLRKLLWSMSQARTFYVLGAGVSYGLIPVTQQMRRIIEADYHAIGIYPTEPAPQSQLFERMFGTISQHEQGIQKILLTHMPLGALELLAQRALWRPSVGVVPTQYAVFDVIGFPATLCNFNLDGLASAYCSHRHNVLEMHGRIDAVLFERMNYGELLEATVAYGLAIPHITPKLLPQVEPDGITRWPAYFKARTLLGYAQAIIILGYSFGQRSDGLDDRHSFEYLSSILRVSPRPIFVVSPTPHDLTGLLRETLSWRHVYGLELRWELFSSAVLANVDPIKGIVTRWSNTDLDRVIRSYENALDDSA